MNKDQYALNTNKKVVAWSTFSRICLFIPLV